MDYNNQFENNTTPNRFNEPKEGGTKSILIGIVSALAVLALVGGGVWLYNSGKGTSSSSSSSSSLSVSNSSKSASIASSSVSISSTTSVVVSSVSSTSSVVVSSASSVATTNGQTTFSDPEFQGLSFNYDSWQIQKDTVTNSNVTIANNGQSTARIVKLMKDDALLEITLTNNAEANDKYYFCMPPNSVQDIQNGWYRVLYGAEGPSYRRFTKAPAISFEKPFNVYQLLGDDQNQTQTRECSADTVAKLRPENDVIQINGKKYFLRINLKGQKGSNQDLRWDILNDRAIADKLVESIKY